MRLVIAEDQASNRIYLTKILQKMGHDVVACENGEQVLDLATRGELPQLVFLDWLMPGMSGLEVCEVLRNVPHLPYTHIVMLTSRTEGTDIVASMRAGANDYMTKPIQVDEFQQRLDNAIRMIELHNTLERQKLQMIQAYRLVGVGQIAQSLVNELSGPILSMLDQLEAIDQALESDDKDSIHKSKNYLAKTMMQIGKTIRGIKLLSSDNNGTRIDVSVVSIFQQVNEFFINQAHNAGVNLYIGQIESDLCFRGNKLELFQAISNLLDNAISAAQGNPGQGWVKLDAHADEESIYITVADSGQGIPVALRPRLFEPFVSSKGGSNGLGLSVTKDIVNRHGGTIRYDAEQKNTSFEIKLPRKTKSALKQAA
jgi:C4-dicarboxylate-specific signal transduction histidine kinase